MNRTSDPAHRTTAGRGDADASGANAETAVDLLADGGSDGGFEAGWTPRRRRWRAGRLSRGCVVAGLALVLVAATGGFLLFRPTEGGTSSDDTVDSTGGTTAEVTRETLMAQTQLDGTLGYGGATAVVIPAGTDAATLQQAQDAVDAAMVSLAGARTAAADTARAGRGSIAEARAAVDAARHTLRAALRTKENVCHAGPSAECTQAKQGVNTAHDQHAQAIAALQTAKSQATTANNQATTAVTTEETTLASAQDSLARARRHAVNAAITYTAIAPAGTTVRRGQRLYAADGIDVPLFYGKVTPWRALYLGISSGPDVAALNNNLAALGYDPHLAGQRDFDSATQSAVEAWQRDLHAEPTGAVALGDVVYRVGPVVVTAVTAAKGQAVQQGATVLTTSPVTRVVTVSLDAAQQGQVKVGDKVTVTLPTGKTTPGEVSSVGTVAAAPADDSEDGSGSGAGATIDVVVKLFRPRAAAGLDKAPVLVGITTATVDDALVVPVTALLALAGGGYAVEVVDPDRSHHLVSVTLGMFDDAKGLVQVTDTELKPGQNVVVPTS